RAARLRRRRAGHARARPRARDPGGVARGRRAPRERDLRLLPRRQAGGAPAPGCGRAGGARGLPPHLARRRLDGRHGAVRPLPRRREASRGDPQSRRGAQLGPGPASRNDRREELPAPRLEDGAELDRAPRGGAAGVARDRQRRLSPAERAPPRHRAAAGPLHRDARLAHLEDLDPNRQGRFLAHQNPGARSPMRLATFKTAQGASYGAVTGKGIVDLRRYLGNQYPDLKALIEANALDQAKKHSAEAPDYQVSDITWLPVIPNPGKIICVGLNYQDHVVETGRDNTEQPAIFLRLAESQVGHKQPIVRPKESTHLDFEAEIAVIIGSAGRRTVQWTAGKNFARTGGFGPWLVTADEIPPNTKMTLSCRLNGERMQHATTEQMIFKIPKIIEYVSTWTTLQPGDVLVTGTPGGVGARRTPPVWMKPGDKVEIEIDKVGILENSIADG